MDPRINAAATAFAAKMLFNNFRFPFERRAIIHRHGPLGARRLADEILRGSETLFQDMFRMGKATFSVLVRWLRCHAGLCGTRYQTAELKLMMVLWILAFAEPQRNVAHRFGVTQSSVSRCIRMLLPMLVSLHKAFVRLPEDDWLDESIEADPRNNSFNGCIGAIDGTHIAAYITGNDRRNRWRGRKGTPTQNVFAAVKQDYSFSYVLAGAEGSLNDAQLIRHAFGRSFRVPADRFYVGDAGFSVRQGIVIPFAHVRYHLNDWREASNRPANAKELYNLRHSRIRVVVEQAFGMVKRRWKIVRIAPIEYSIRHQVMIVYAVTGLHNFIIAQGEKEEPTSAVVAIMARARERAKRTVAGRHADYVRMTTATTSWAEYQLYLQSGREEA